MKTQKTEFEKKLGRRKLRLYIVFAISLIISLVSAWFIMVDQFNALVQPQISRAIIRISKMFPEIEYNDINLREAYEGTIEWQKWYYEKMELPKDKQSDFMLDEGNYSLPDESLSWIQRISRIKVGYDGYVTVVSKKDGKILSHPDSNYEGKRMMILDSNRVVSMNEASSPASYDMLNVKQNMTAEDLKADYSFMAPEGVSDLNGIINNVIVGYAVSYNDTYIIFGVSFKEMFSFMAKGFIITLIAFIVLWVLIYYISMLITRHEKSGKVLRSKLVARMTLIAVGLMLTSWYIYNLSGTTLTLTTMEQHSKAAVDTLEDFRKSRENIDKWIDERYLTQCKFIADLMMSDKLSPGDLDREGLQEIADVFGVKYIFRYDKFGSVESTNSPYDNIYLSKDEESQSYIFRKLLNGVDHVIQEPVVDELSGEYLQYIGVSLRDKNDFSDGFVQIAVDPTLRTNLTEWLTVDTVLENLLIGLPEYAVAIDKETMLISNTTGLGFVGDSVETLGLTPEKLSDYTSSILTIRGVDYYAGFGESSDLYIVPCVTQTENFVNFGDAVKVVIIPVITLILIAVLALWGYQKNVYEAAPEETEAEDAEENASDKSSEDDEDDGWLSGFSDFVKVREKYGMDDRWKTSIPLREQTPETRVKSIAIALIFLFCLTILVPIMYYTFSGIQMNGALNSIAYVIKGSWDKGVNIFAFTSCIFLLCGLYVFVATADRVLYKIARISGTRTETVCLLLRSSLKYVCAIIFIYYGLSQFGIPTQTLLASAGLLSLLLTFGAKDLVGDIIAGFFIIFEGTIKVGDWVTLGSWSGLVLEVGVRTTKIKYFADTKIVNNSQIRELVNADGETAKMTIKFLIPYTIKLEEFEKILDKELPKMGEKVEWLKKPPKYQFVGGFESNGLMLRIVLYTVPYKRMVAQRAFLRELKLMFERYNIDYPYDRIVAYGAKYEPLTMISGDSDNDTDESDSVPSLEAESGDAKGKKNGSESTMEDL